MDIIGCIIDILAIVLSLIQMMSDSFSDLPKERKTEREIEIIRVEYEEPDSKEQEQIELSEMERQHWGNWI